MRGLSDVDQDYGEDKVLCLCERCGNPYPRWVFFCANCDSWLSVVDQGVKQGEGQKRGGAPSDTKSVRQGGARVTGCQGYSGATSIGVVTLAELSDEPLARVSTGIDEFDKLLGGGLVLGSVNLLAGNPGSFKSTLALQVANYVSGSCRAVYFSAEEGSQSLKARAVRLECESSVLGISFTAEVTSIIDELKGAAVKVVVIDSLQAIRHKDSEAAAQVQAVACLKELYAYAHQNGIAMIIVCQANKQEQMAGSREIEYMGDAMFYMKRTENSDRSVDIKASKNRNGGVSTTITLQINPQSGALFS